MTSAIGGLRVADVRDVASEVPDGGYTIHALALISGRWDYLSGGPAITVDNP